MTKQDFGFSATYAARIALDRYLLDLATIIETIRPDFVRDPETGEWLFRFGGKLILAATPYFSDANGILIQTRDDKLSVGPSRLLPFAMLCMNMTDDANDYLIAVTPFVSKARAEQQAIVEQRATSANSTIKRLKANAEALALEAERYERAYGDDEAMPLSERTRLEDVRDRLDKLRETMKVGVELSRTDK